FYYSLSIPRPPDTTPYPYTTLFRSRALASWARRIRNWDRDRRDVYVYFDNDVKVKAPFDALNLMGKLGLEWQPADATCEEPLTVDRKSTRLNSSHRTISYAVFCLKK